MLYSPSPSNKDLSPVKEKQQGTEQEKPSRQTILIVDDSEANRMLLNDQIFALGHTPMLAENGLSALSKITENPPSLILLDVMMPEMNGIEVLDRLKADSQLCHIPVIMISALDQMNSIVHCIQNGALDYLVKPFNPTLLKARINAALASKKLRDQEQAYRKKIENYNSLLEQKVRERTRELEETRLEVVHRLGRAAEYRDYETGMHVVRMSHLCRLLGSAAGMDEKTCQLLQLSSPMHDIGKIGIPDYILLKPDKLSDSEWEVMKTHTTIGGKILDGGRSELMKMAKTIALTHQEKWDGSGYPKGLKEKEIPLVGRISAVCDVFDALTSERPYKKAYSVEESIRIMEKGRGRHFDPQLFDLFKQNLSAMVEIIQKYRD